MGISRRNMLIASGASVALVACGGGKSPSDATPRLSVRQKILSGGLNQGDRPWENEYASGQGDHGPLVDFKTKKLCLLYLDVALNPFALEVARIHFDHPTDASRWEDVESYVTDWINKLNALPFPTAPVTPTQPPWNVFNNVPPNKYWLGFGDFAFNQQHHVVIYFKTPGIGFPLRHPLWFGDTLQGKVLGYGDAQNRAHRNYSFYGAARKDIALTNTTSGFGKHIIYMRNHYQKLVTNGYESLSSTDREVFSLNINLITRTKYGNREIPIILDPDTGNMGEGQP